MRSELKVPLSKSQEKILLKALPIYFEKRWYRSGDQDPFLENGHLIVDAYEMSTILWFVPLNFDDDFEIFKLRKTAKEIIEKRISRCIRRSSISNYESCIKSLDSVEFGASVNNLGRKKAKELQRQRGKIKLLDLDSSDSLLSMGIPTI